MRVTNRQLHPPPSKNFTRLTDEAAFTTRHHRVHTTTIYILRPPRTLSDNRPWIISPDSSTTSTSTSAAAETTVILRHPLTFKPQLFNLPRNFDFSQFHPSAIAVFHHLDQSYRVDKLLTFGHRTMLALYGGGKLRGCPCRATATKSAEVSESKSPWVKLSPGENFDDITNYDNTVYAVNRRGIVNVIYYYRTREKFRIGRTLIYESVSSGSGRFGWRKRLVVDGVHMYLVVRMAENSFRVFRFRRIGKKASWNEVGGFEGNKVLFMGRDHYFFRRAEKFPGVEYKNCIVFSEAAFPRYGKDCWEFTETGKRFGVVRRCEDDVAVFRVSDRVFAREGENSGFPKINWSPPAWIFKGNSASVSSSQSERETSGSRDENDGEVQSDVKDSDSKDEEEQEEMESNLKDSDSKDEEEQEEMESDLGSQDENDGEVQSDSKGSNSKDEEEQEEMESDLGSQDQAREVVEIVESDSDSQGEVQEVVEIMESDSDIQVQDDGEMQCDSNSEEKEEKKMHSKANIEGDASLQEDIVTPLLSAVEEEVTKTLLSMNSRNDVVEEEVSGKNSIHLIPKACTSSTTQIHTSCSATTKFEGLDVRSDLVPTLQKIWRKHGNITKDSIVRSNDIIARALESLATVVQILEDNLAESLSDSQADYLSTTLSDLKCIRFKVCWLVSFVEKALKIHKSKDLMESLNNLSQLSSQIKERKSVILDEVAKLNEEENKLKEEMAKVEKWAYSGLVMINVYGRMVDSYAVLVYLWFILS
ncbi:uncharacterized protein LOC141610883 isoform X2 [Silene latifolia]|uniref:uncharacterized protein LOC141610883 isoform X2 n=1 Tax=Silene latifolia TaxID=37657 RepID=UPI003D7742C5